MYRETTSSTRVHRHCISYKPTSSTCLHPHTMACTQHTHTPHLPLSRHHRLSLVHHILLAHTTLHTGPHPIHVHTHTHDVYVRSYLRMHACTQCTHRYTHAQLSCGGSEGGKSAVRMVRSNAFLLSPLELEERTQPQATATSSLPHSSREPCQSSRETWKVSVAILVGTGVQRPI